MEGKDEGKIMRGREEEVNEVFGTKVLDEPTNHLDLQTVEALGDALKAGLAGLAGLVLEVSTEAALRNSMEAWWSLPTTVACCARFVKFLSCIHGLTPLHILFTENGGLNTSV